MRKDVNTLKKECFDKLTDMGGKNFGRFFLIEFLPLDNSLDYPAVVAWIVRASTYHSVYTRSGDRWTESHLRYKYGC